MEQSFNNFTKILKTDKSWKSVDLTKSSEKLDKAREIIAAQLTPKSLYVQGEQYKLGRVVREVCQLVCGSVVHSFVFDHQLMAHLDVARCFLLLHDSQFSHILYRQFCEQTHGLRSRLSQLDAKYALMTALTLSNSSRRFRFKLNLDTLSSANDSPNTSSRLQFVPLLQPVYRPNGPIGEVFKDTEEKYESLFHFVCSVEMCLLTISDSVNEVTHSPRNATKCANELIVLVLRLVSCLLSVCEGTLLGMGIHITTVICLLVPLSEIRSLFRQPLFTME